jgi:hypothetical protein
MRKLIVLGGIGAAAAIGVTLWQDQDPPSSTPQTAATRMQAPAAATAPEPSFTAPRDAAPLRRSVDDSAAQEQIGPEAPEAEADDGDDHGHTQGTIQPLEQPPLSRDAFGANPESETAAIAEVRATLEALLDDPDPAVKEQASALLETIAAP